MANEIGIEDARAKLGDLANAAHYSGTTTYLTRHGRRIAAITAALPDNPTELAKDVITYGDDHGAQTKLHQIYPKLAGIWHALDAIARAEQNQRLEAGGEEGWLDALVGDISAPLSPQHQAVADLYQQHLHNIADTDKE